MAETKTKVTELPIEETGLPSEETIEATEYDLIQGLLAAEAYKEDEDLRKKISIRRKGVLLFEFTVTPLSEEDLYRARKESRIMMKNPAGKNLPKVEKEVDYGKMKSWKIYLATIPEDRAKIWDNKTFKEKHNTMFGADMVDVFLTGGEKSMVADIIDNISGYDMEETDLTEYAKN